MEERRRRKLSPEEIRRRKIKKLVRYLVPRSVAFCLVTILVILIGSSRVNHINGKSRNAVDDAVVTEYKDVALIDFDENNSPDNSDTAEKNLSDPFYEISGIKFYKVQGDLYTGTMCVIEDPQRVFVGTCGDYTGEAGLSVPQICEKYSATLAINAGGMEDPGGYGDGGTPIGIVISQGALKFGSLTESYDIIGFDNDNNFVIGNMTGQQALDRGVRDAVSFGPFLVVDGVEQSVAGQRGGLNLRSAIGQRADGAVLILAIDGRAAHSLGAMMEDVAAVMVEYGAVNAANLDGGGSTVLYYDGTIQNSMSCIFGARGCPTAFLVQ